MAHDLWRKQLRMFLVVAHYIYLGPILLIVGAYLAFPPIAHQTWRAEFRILFYAFFTVAAGSLLFAWWLHSQIMSLETLEMRMKGVGFYAALSSLKVGVVVCASLGDFCASLALTYYFVSRQPTHLAMLMGFWALHYLAGVRWMRQGIEHLEQIFAKDPAEKLPVDKAA